MKQPYLRKIDEATTTTYYDLAPQPRIYEVDYCLVQPAPTEALVCRIEFSTGNMATICVLNLAKTLVMFFTWLIPRWQWNGEIEVK